MNPKSRTASPPSFASRGARRADVLDSLVQLASRQANAQIDAFSARLANALLAQSQASRDADEARLSFMYGNLLKENQYAFFHLASQRLEERLRAAVDALHDKGVAAPVVEKAELSLVPYEEMEQEVLLGSASRPYEAENEAVLDTLNRRLAVLLERDVLASRSNPFRPEVFLDAIVATWTEFLPEGGPDFPIMPLLRPELFLDLGEILRALDAALAARGVEDHAPHGGAIRKARQAGVQADADPAALSNQLKRLFALDAPPASAAPGPAFAPAGSDLMPQLPQPALPVSAQLLGMLADLQRQGGWAQRPAFAPAGEGHARMPIDDPVQPESGAEQPAPPAGQRSQLRQLKRQLPHGALSRHDETTIDLLGTVFDTIFEDPHIPSEMKDLIGLLQIPVLKAALIEKEFFYQEAHPARRLIELLSRSSIGWDSSKGRDDPLYQAIKRNVDRVQQDFAHELGVFSDVLSDLEAHIEREEAAASEALAAPINQALKTERMRTATKAAENDVAVRLSTGEVATFVEAFLEKRWVPILALAYTVKDEKPQLLAHAVQTMDDLIWSVKPKVTAEERKELIGKLPELLAALNKWIGLMKWDDAERMQFFADLAECHASIVRAPLELSPQRQVEVAVEAAKRAAEKRAAQRANLPEPVLDEHVETVETLERGVWLNFTQPDGGAKKVKLAWVSPLRSLYIFSTSSKEEAFSLSAEALAQAFREGRAGIVVADRFVDRALSRALAGQGAEVALAV
ncbi:MAG TPA: DUF1631 family protein [Noviherbaspirillum sp.]|nr:DUF1631 family protein [Noviherbaspirillum sp.]